MTSSAPWLAKLTDASSVTDVTLFDAATQTTYIFSNKFTQLSVKIPRSQNGSPQRVLVENFFEQVRPIGLAQNVDGLDGHNHGIVCWKTKIDGDKGMLLLVVIWVHAGSLHREEHVLFTSGNLKQANEHVSTPSVVLLLSQLQSVHYVSDQRYILNTGDNLLLLQVDESNASVWPLHMKRIDMKGVVDDSTKHLLQFVDFRPSHRPGVYLLLLFYPLSFSNPGLADIVLETRGQLIVFEVGIALAGDVPVFTREAGMFAAALSQHDFTHDTAIATDELNDRYIIAVAESNKVEIHEVHTAPVHAIHVADSTLNEGRQGQRVHSLQGIAHNVAAIQGARARTLCIVTPRAEGWGFPDGSTYEVLIEGTEGEAVIEHRILREGSLFKHGQRQIRYEN